MKRWFGLLGIASVLVLLIGLVSNIDAVDTEVRSTVSEFLIRPERAVPVGIRVVGGGIAAVATTSVSEETALGRGTYSLVISVRDVANNQSETVISNLRAESDLKLKQLLSGPNPFNPN